MLAAEPAVHLLFTSKADALGVKRLCALNCTCLGFPPSLYQLFSWFSLNRGFVISVTLEAAEAMLLEASVYLKSSDAFTVFV